MYSESSTDANLIMFMQSLGVPLLVTLLGVGVYWLLHRRLRSPSVVVLPSLAAGFWISFCWIQGRLVLWPQQAMDVLIPLLLFATLWELWRLRRGSVNHSILFIALLGFVGWMLYPILSRSEVMEIVLTLLAVALFYVALSVGYQRADNRPVQNLLGLLLVALAAPVFALDGTLKLAQFAGALASGLGVIWFAGLLWPKLDFRGGVAPLMITGLYVAGHQYAEVNIYALLLTSLGVLLLVSVGRRWSAASLWGDNLRAAVAAAIPAAVALWLIWPQESLY